MKVIVRSHTVGAQDDGRYQVVTEIRQTTKEAASGAMHLPAVEDLIKSCTEEHLKTTRRVIREIEVGRG